VRARHGRVSPGWYGRRTERTAAITIAPLERADLPQADAVFRLAFGTQLGLADPLRFAEGAEPIRGRWTSGAAGAFRAVVDEQLVGSAFVARWGSFAVFGPLTVRPDHWGHGVGSLLWEACAPLLDEWGITSTGLFTLPESPKHIHLYRKHGFWPGFLTALTEKPVAARDGTVETHTSLDTAGRTAALGAYAVLTDAIYPGLDLTHEIDAVVDQAVGDVVLVREGDEIAGLAVCHAGEGSEAVSGSCYVKFAAVRGGDGGPGRLERLLDACETFAASGGATRLEVGVSLGREAAARLLAARGHRTFRHGVAMHRPGPAAFDGPDALVLDDRR
jgi:GNAT superfamily N-acetyltransferase